MFKKKEVPAGRRGRRYLSRFGSADGVGSEDNPPAEVPEADLGEANDPAPVDPPEPKAKAARGRVPAASPIAADSNLIDIWERRMVNPDGISAPLIHLRTPGMHLRWVNTGQTGRYQRAVYEQGWVPVSKSELADEREVRGAQYTIEGYVTRGDRQHEMLMKMPEAIFKRIQSRKAEIRHKEYQKIREQMAGAAGKHFSEKYDAQAGDAAGEIIAGFKGDIKFGTERVNFGNDD